MSLDAADPMSTDPAAAVGREPAVAPVASVAPAAFSASGTSGASGVPAAAATAGTSSAAAATGASALPTRRGRATCIAFVWVLAVLAAAALIFVRPGGPPLFALRLPHSTHAILGWLGLLLGFVAAERTQAHIEVRRQTFRLTLTEVPLVIGMVLLTPLSLLLVSLLARIVCWVGQTNTAFKKVFNLGVCVLEIAVAELVAQAIGYRVPLLSQPLLANPLSARSTAAIFAGVEATTVTGAAVVLLAATILYGSVDRELRRRIVVVSSVSAALCAVFALLALALAPDDGVGLVLLVLLLIGAIAAYGEYARLVRQHRRVNQLYDFSIALSASPAQAHELAQHTLPQVCEALECEKAIFWQIDDDGTLQSTSHGLSDADARHSLGVASLVHATRKPLLVGAPAHPVFTLRGAAAESHPLPQGLVETLLVPVFGSDGIAGVLQVADRLSEATRMREDDIRILSTLAAQLATSMESTARGDQLEHAAFHDPLTGLANRNRFSVELAAAVEQSRAGEASAVLLMDLDRFKEVNDSLGHHVGDQLLAAVADRIQRAIPSSAIAARLGGDEFAVLVPVAWGQVGYDDAVQAALLLRQAIEHPIVIAGVDLVVSASIGIALLPRHGQEATLLLQRADVAMYAAKGGDRPVAVYESRLDDDSARHLRLAADLRGALERGELDTVFQPKIDLATDTLVGVEALSRWSHPVHGPISPDEFIPIAERTGLIVPLTESVLAAAVRQCEVWRRRGLDIGVAVNVSLRGLLDDAFVDGVAALLAGHDVPPSLLTLELTESSVMRDPERTLPLLHNLRDMGVRLSVDDFGTGYSSLAHLRRLPVHEVKVDKSFVLTMSTDPANAAIVRAVVDLGVTLGLSVVAEGVEDTHSRDALLAMGCAMAQGYLFARPLPTERLDMWMAEHRIRHIAAALPEPRR